eukprot:358199-Amphidinium_carterae.1
MDHHVKHMMRSIDSLKNQGEYNMDTVTGSLFAKLKSVLLCGLSDLCCDERNIWNYESTS